MKRLIAIFCTIILILANNTWALAPQPLPNPRIVSKFMIQIEEMESSYSIEEEEVTTVEVIEEGPLVEITREVEFPTAEFIWSYLKELGFNDYICAGILGNMMVESGGLTLAIEENARTGNFYGICQWSKKYYPDVIGVSLNAQCDYLRDTIQNEIDTFGYCYKKGFNYENFLQITDEKEAALAFAKCYERCSNRGYSTRKECASIAYNYFINLE